jgi:hypothetical protein
MAAFEFGSIDQLLRDDNSVTEDDDSDSDVGGIAQFAGDLRSGRRVAYDDEEDEDDEVINDLLIAAERLGLNRSSSNKTNATTATTTNAPNPKPDESHGMHPSGAPKQTTNATYTIEEESSDDDDDDEEILKNFVADPFYDDKLDAKDQRWVERSLMPGADVGKGSNDELEGNKGQFEQGIGLTCPCCFTTLCHHSQQHEVYHNQYRAIYVVNCVLKTGETLSVQSPATGEGEGEEEEDSEAETGDEVLVPVHCATCGAGVGVHSPVDGVFEFFQVIPSS